MLSYFKFRQELFDPVPARDVYVKRPTGRGWPEECPPIRAANGFGFDLLANFDVTFVQGKSGWSVAKDVEVDSDFDWAGTDGQGRPLRQRYAWFWDKGQTIPHPITDDVYEQVRHQVKLSTFLYLKTDPNELLLMTDVPHGPPRAWRPMASLVETDWFPASYPWHAVLELDPAAKRVSIKKGDPLVRVVPVRRDTYFAQQMSPTAFDDFFARGQTWLATHGSFEHESSATAGGEAAGCPAGVADITRTYVKQQVRARFVVMT